MFAVKARKTGDKAWHFVTPKGGMNRLRVHASLYPSNEAAALAATELGKLNTGYEFKAVSLTTGGK